MWFGVAIIVVGVVLLLQNLGLVTGGAWSIVWPALIIILGIALIAKKENHSSEQTTVSKNEKEK